LILRRAILTWKHIGGKGWRDQELELGLKERLPRSYEVYLEIVYEIITVMESLKHELGVDMPAFQSMVACEEVCFRVL
jgi:hypothetical protein